MFSLAHKKRKNNIKDIKILKLILYNNVKMRFYLLYYLWVLFMKNDAVKERLYKILLKKAKGFYCKEVVDEYVYEQKSDARVKKKKDDAYIQQSKKNNKRVLQLSCYDICEAEDTIVNESKEILMGSNVGNSVVKNNSERQSDGSDQKKEGSLFIHSGVLKNYELDYDQNNHETSLVSNDCVKQGEENVNEDIKPLTLVKKKVTTHFVPPDMLAIKMLLEIDKEVGEDLSLLSSEELLTLANKLKNELDL